MLALDRLGRLISCVFLQRGTTDSAPFYVRHVLGEVVRTNAHAIVISHNHPNNSLLPSRDDVGCTLSLIIALQPLGVPPARPRGDRRSTGGEHPRLGYVKKNVWLAQAPDDPLLAGWLEGTPIV